MSRGARPGLRMAGELLALQPGEENIPANLLVHMAALVRKVGGGGHIFEPEALPAIHNIEGGREFLLSKSISTRPVTLPKFSSLHAASCSNRW